VLVYFRDAKNSNSRQNFLDNLVTNGLEVEVKDDDQERLIFVLVKIPFEKCLEVAEKIRLKLPIEINDMEKENDNLHNLWSIFWDHFESLRPFEVRKDKKRDYFTAQYSSNIRKK
jgi:hypothetical protein